MNIPYQNPQVVPSSVSIRRIGGNGPSLQVATVAPKQQKRVTTLTLDDDLTKRLTAFADGEGMSTLNEAIRLLLRTALSADPVLAAIAEARRRVIWEQRVRFFSAANQFFSEQMEMNTILRSDAQEHLSAYRDESNEEPPTW